MQKLMGLVRRCVDDYDMIREGDKIAVGVSAGKDSLTLLCAMAELRRFYPIPFELIAITVDMGFEGADFSSIQKLCDQLDVPYHIAKTDIYDIIFNRDDLSVADKFAIMGIIYSVLDEYSYVSEAVVTAYAMAYAEAKATGAIDAELLQKGIDMIYTVE